MVAVIDTGDELADQLQRTDGGLSLQRARTAEGVAADVIVIGPGCKDPVRTCQSLRDRGVPVLICVPEDRAPQVRRQIQFSPMLPAEVEIVQGAHPETVARSVQAALERTQRRRRHAASISAANALLASSVPPAPPHPYLDRLLEAAPIGILTVDPTGRVLSSNQRASEIFDGIDLTANVCIADLFDALSANVVRELTAVESGAMPRCASRIDAGGGLRHFEIRSAHFRDQVGESAVLFVVQDVTDLRSALDRAESLFITSERRRQEAEVAAQQLRLMNAELEQFAYVASHDLQEPLRTVTSFAQLLKRRYGGRLEKDADEFIDQVVNGAKRMQVLIQDLLNYSRAVREDDVAEETVDMNAALVSSLASLRGAVDESGAVVTSDPLPVLPAARETQMEQLLVNLIGNAIKYHRFGVAPAVHISAERRGRTWQFAVRDNGQGFDPAYADRIFGVFKRLHGREVPGTGIGLALCKRIVERHGGRIWATSKPGEGSTFFFTIPS